MRLIDASDLQVLPRGRKAEYDVELLAVLAEIPSGQFGVLDEEFEPALTSKSKSKVQGIIRKHWARVHGTKCTVRWTPDGFPQVGEKAEA